MSGEKQGKREAMDRMVQRLTSQGVPVESAKKTARECAVRSDRRDDRKR